MLGKEENLLLSYEDGMAYILEESLNQVMTAPYLSFNVTKNRTGRIDLSREKKGGK